MKGKSRKFLALCSSILLSTVGGFLTVTAVSHIKADANEPEWTYGGTNNPTRWGELNPDFRLCGQGRNQSPINIDGSSTGVRPRIQFNYQPTPLEVENNGRTIEIPYRPGSWVIIDGRRYDLLQFHFHTPSEHQVNGISYAMEAHLVHRNNAGNIAVIGVFIQEGEENDFLEQIWEILPETVGTNEEEDISINVRDLLPGDEAHYNYRGSLTTPPCSQNVVWTVLEMPIEASAEQIDRFTEIYQVNARPIQNINGRRIRLRR